jgi:hypothetical protein
VRGVSKDVENGQLLMVTGLSNDPQETSALLIDFNRGEHLDSHQGPEFDRVDRTVSGVLSLSVIWSHDFARERLCLSLRLLTWGMQSHFLRKSRLSLQSPIVLNPTL